MKMLGVALVALAACASAITAPKNTAEGEYISTAGGYLPMLDSPNELIRTQNEVGLMHVMIGITAEGRSALHSGATRLRFQSVSPESSRVWT